jgi:hypothetical protein
MRDLFAEACAAPPPAPAAAVACAASAEDDMHEEMEDHRLEGDRWSSGDAGSDLVGGVLLDPDVTEYDFAEFEGAEYVPW